MGFIPQVSTKTLYAYLTPKGRKYILDGNQEDFQVAFFSLHDDDVNYFISSNISAGTAYYTLQSGFIPDITGDADTCIKSISDGTTVNMLCTLSGSTIIDPTTNAPTVGPIGSSGTIGGRNTVISGPLTTTLNGGTLDTAKANQNTSFAVSITPPINNAAAPLTTTEIQNSKFNVRISNPSPSAFFANFKINNTPISLNTDFLVTPTTASQAVSIIYTIAGSLNTTQTVGFDITITPVSSNNSVTRGSLKYTATFPVTTTNNDGRIVGGTTTPPPDVEGPGGTGDGNGNGTGFSNPPTTG
jgi:hypothetical protein